MSQSQWFQRKEIRTAVGNPGHSLCVCTNDGPSGRVDKVGSIRACAWLEGCLERAGREGSGCGEDGEDQGRSAEDLAEHGG